jgi:hypothetical protein
MNRFLQSLTILTAPLVLSACGALNINLTFVGEKTALERQVLGAYEEIGRDLASFGSVRAIEPDGSLREPAPRTASQQRFLEALAARQFNRDDVGMLLAAGYLREGNDAMLSVNPEWSGTLPLPAAEVEALIADENNNRRVLLDRLVETTPGVTEADRPAVAWVIATLNHDQAPAGALLQDRNGAWRIK